MEDFKKQLEETIIELNEIQSTSDWEKIGKLTKQKEDLESNIEKQENIENLKNQLKEAEKLLITEKDPELLNLVRTEKEEITITLERAKKIFDRILKGEESSANSVIMEIRAGTGGDEAGLFAFNLFEMYTKFADSQGWKTKILNDHRTEVGGYKEVSFQIDGDQVHHRLQHEAGVHRVQRIPTTEKQGRIHTSTASVAILVKPKKQDITVKTEDLQIDTFRSSGPGGQNVNKRETAIRITHVPTGLVVESQTERNQLKNKENALSILQARILEQQDINAKKEMTDERKSQVGQAMRSEKIRTYNYPQNRVTDHRIKKTWHNIEGTMTGEISDMIEALEEL
jgi:peptide chain release factor 1